MLFLTMDPEIGLSVLEGLACKSRLSDKEEDWPKKEESLRERNSSANSVGAGQAGAAEAACDLDAWKPLLLIIPLRLGLTDINPVYFDSLKVGIM